MSFKKTTGQMKDESLKKPRTTGYICPIFTSSQLATTQQTEHLTQLAPRTKTGQIRTQVAPGCSPGEREATRGLRVVGDRQEEFLW